MKKETGVGKWISRLRAYGYIHPDDDGNHKLKNGERFDSDLANRGKDPKGKNIGPGHK